MAKGKRPRTNKKIRVVIKQFKERFLGRFKNKKIPIRYRRKTPDGFKKVKFTRYIYTINTGYLVEFGYGDHQYQGQVGGWKNDPTPVVLNFFDDGKMYIEGINTNYLSDRYLAYLMTMMRRFPGMGSVDLYSVFKRTAPMLIKLGYRKYIRSSMRDVYIYVYEDEFLREYDRLLKMNQKKDKAIRGNRTVAHVMRKDAKEV